MVLKVSKFFGKFSPLEMERQEVHELSARGDGDPREIIRGAEWGNLLNQGRGEWVALFESQRQEGPKT